MSGSHHQSQVDDFRSGCRNVSHHYRQQSFSGLHLPGRSSYTITCYPRVQTIYCILECLLLIMSLRLRWIHCGRCNNSWFQALLVRLATRRTDPRRTLPVIQAMLYKEPQSLGSMY